MINEDANKPMRYNHKTKRKLLFYLMMTSSRNANANPCNIILILFFLLIDKLVLMDGSDDKSDRTVMGSYSLAIL